MTIPRKAVWGWALYDWANSAFATTVMAGLFPLFFNQYWSAGADQSLTTARLGLANSLASLVVALLAPVLGAIADQGGIRKKLLILFAYVGALSTACLYGVSQGQWLWAAFFYIIGNIGFAGANTFYDSMLPLVAGRDKVDYVSGLGYALGYLGGGLLFLINVLMVLNPGWFFLDEASQAVRWSFLSVGAWWAGFTALTIIWVPAEKPGGQRGAWTEVVGRGFRQLAGTVRKLRQLRVVVLFLLAYWCYIDGVHTVIRMAVAFGLSLGFESDHLIVALLITQFVGFPSALVFGRLGQRWGPRWGIYLALGVYIFVCLFGMTMTRPWHFYLLAVTVGLVQGGIQALSRSFYTRLIPAGQSAEFFGFFNMLGKFAAILGPGLMGLAALGLRALIMPAAPSPEEFLQAEQLAVRLSIGSIVILFLAGAVLFRFVDEDKGRLEAARFTES